MTRTPTVKESAKVANGTWVRSLMTVAVALGGILLLSNLPFISDGLHIYLSALPLAIAGIVYAMLQLRVRPRRGTLLKRLLLAATFVIWAVDQLLPSGSLATFIGDVVISAYVLDLYWLVQEQMAAVNSECRIDKTCVDTQVAGQD